MLAQLLDQLVPPAVGKEGSYVDNGWQIRQLLAADQKVLACFHGHKHRSRWAMYGGVHYVTLAGMPSDSLSQTAPLSKVRTVGA